VASAGGQLLGAAFQFLGELVDQKEVPSPPTDLVERMRAGLETCVEKDGEGKPRVTFTLPDAGALEGLAQTLAKLLALGGGAKP
jgi:hypothetical protein